jgi:WD40 repeat protein
LSGSLVVLAALTAKADTTTEAQALSVASTWQLPVEVKAVWFALSPDSGSLALMRTNGDVEIWNTASRQPQRKIAAPTRPPNWFFGHSLAFSPDGQWLAILNGGPLRLVRLAGDTNEIVIGDARDSFMGIKFSGNNRCLLVSGRTEYVVSLPEGKAVGSFHTVSPGVAGPPVLRPLSQFGQPSRPIRSFTSALSPDGSEVALGQKHWEVERWDVATGQCLGFVSLGVAGMPLPQSPVSVLNYSSCSKQLVAVLDGNQWDVVLVEPDGKWRTLLHQTSLGQKQTSPRRAISDAFFTPDGREVVVLAEKLDLGHSPQLLFAKSVGAEVQFLDTAAGTVTRRLESTQSGFFSQAWISADGQRLMVLQRTYSMVPRTHAERQGPHLYQADLAAALLTVSLERQPKASKP